MEPLALAQSGSNAASAFQSTANSAPAEKGSNDAEISQTASMAQRWPPAPVEEKGSNSITELEPLGNAVLQGESGEELQYTPNPIHLLSLFRAVD